MADSKVIAVIGATGAQGGGLVRAMFADRSGGWKARAITRHPQSDNAKALAAEGAEVIGADADDPASIARAFEGAEAAFCVTNFWEHSDPDRELAQAKALADGARAANVRHVIWSTLEDTRKFIPLDDDRMPTLMGRFKVPHFDAKGEADAFFGDLPATLLRTSFYWDNFISFGMGPRRGEDGKLALAMPLGDAKLPGMAAADIGKCAYAIFKRGQEFIGRTVGIAGEHLSGAGLATGLSRGLGEPVKYVSIPFEVYRGLGFPGADDIGNMFQYNVEFAEEFGRVRDVAFSRALNPDMQSFDTWVSQNKERIPVA